MTDRPQLSDPLPPSDPGDGAPSPLVRTPRSRSWLWPTVALVLVLIVVIAVGKLGQTPDVQSSRSSAPTSIAAARVTGPPLRPATSLPLVRRPISAASASLIGAPIGIRSDGQRYDDGVPAVLLGEDVIRVRDAAALPLGTAALVGGWLSRSACTADSGASDCPALFSDVPFRSPRVAELVLAGQASFDSSSGPRVFQAAVQADPSCTLSALGECLGQLAVGEPLWAGDEQTTTSPVTAPALLADLAPRFPTLDFQPFEEATSCPVAWPAQSYLVSTPEAPSVGRPGIAVRFVAVFANTTDLNAQEAGLRQSAATMTGFEASNRCVLVPADPDDAAWVVSDNVMVLLGADDETVRAQVVAALEGAVASD